MRYSYSVEAIQLKDAVYDKDGKKLADKGDFLVIDNHEQYYTSKEEFQRKFYASSCNISVPTYSWTPIRYNNENLMFNRFNSISHMV